MAKAGAKRRLLLASNAKKCKSYGYQSFMNQNDLEHIFIESFDTYSDAIFRFCLFKVTNVELAEDFTQEVFARYWQALRMGKEITNTRSYLYTIANNMAKDWYKKKKSESLDVRIEKGLEPHEKQTVNAEEQAAYNEILSVIEDLEGMDREILLLRYVEGLEPRDIAEIIGESANLVSVRINRAIKRLQQQFHL